MCLLLYFHQHYCHQTVPLNSAVNQAERWRNRKGRNILMMKESKKSMLKIFLLLQLLVLSAVYAGSVIAQAVPGVH